MKKIKIGILTDSDYTPYWAFEMVRMVKELPYVSIDLVVTNNKKLEKKSLFIKVYSRLRIFFTVVYLTLDQKIFKSKIDAFQPKSFRDLLPDAQWYGVSPKMTKYRDSFEVKDIEYIRSFDLDIILCRGFRILSGDILKSSKYGVWSYHHGDNRVNRGRPAIFYETVQQWLTIGTIFQILGEALDGGTVLYKSFSGHKSRFIFKNMNAVYWKSSYFFKRCIEQLQALGWEEFKKRKRELNNDIVYDRPIYFIPNNLKFLRLIVAHYLRMISESIYNIFYEEKWHLALSRNRDQDTINLNNFKVLKSPKDVFWADPMAIEFEGSNYIFFEEYSYKKKKAHISFFKIDEKKPFKSNYQSEIALETEYHLSYPFVFKLENQLYMIPESKENNSIDLYKFDGNKRFLFVKTLIKNIKAVDNTLYYHQNNYFLFCNVQPHPESMTYDELHIFYSSDLFSEDFKSHIMNPVISDVRKSRPAGPIFMNKNRLIRPSQICVPYYGYGVSLSEIIKLNQDEYKEREIDKIEPKFNHKVKGVHTISLSSKYKVVDFAIKKRK